VAEKKKPKDTGVGPVISIRRRSDAVTTTRGRDARTGAFTTVKTARQHPKTHVVERVPKPGYGDTKKGTKKK